MLPTCAPNSLSFTSREPRLQATVGALGLTLLALTAHAQVSSESAAVPPVTDAADAASTLAPVTVTATADGSPSNVAPPFSGGQVARGGQLGVLGTTRLQDAPFNITSYTAELLENQQARSVTDAVANDPSVRSSVSSGSFYENVTIRGFALGASEIGLLGLYGLTPTTRTSVEFAERVDVIKGPAAMVTGMPPGGAIGGSVSISPKRAGDDPLTRLTGGLDLKSRAGVHLDLGRRFGENKALGVRVNAVTRNGEGAVDGEERKTQLGSIALDYRGERVRLALDAYQLEQEQDGGTYGFTSSGVIPYRVPDASKPTILGERAQMRDKMALLSGEVDLTDNLSAYAKYGWHTSKVLGVRTRITNLTLDGSYRGGYAVQNGKNDFESGEAGVRLNVTTGPIHHRMVASISRFSQENFSANFNAATRDYVLRSIYAPTILPAPKEWPTDRRKASETRLQSVTLADTMSILDERLLLTLGVRRQTVAVDNFNTLTGATTTRYDESATTPAVGLVFKSGQNVSLYANYIQGLTRGPTAPTGTGLVNEGEVFPPYKSKQYEVGAKGEWDGLGASVSLYQIARPNTLTVNNRFGLDGEQRNRGLEFNVYGELARGVRVLGGLALMDAKITKATAAIEGKRAFGIPRQQANIGMEWDPAFAPGLTLTARLLHTGSVYLNNANSSQVPSWKRWDVGARYATKISGRPVTFRANIENLLGKDYWMANDVENWLSLSAPRTVMLSTTVDF